MVDPVPVGNIQKENFQNICRSCLTEATFGNIFEISYDQIVLATMLDKILATKIDPNDEMPKNLCEKCIDEVVQCHNFRKRFDDSEVILRGILESAKRENPPKLLNSEIKCHVDLTQEALEFRRVPADEEEGGEVETTDTRTFSLELQTNEIIPTQQRERKDNMCRICDKILSSLRNLRDHIKRMHVPKSRREKHICEHCGKRFLSKIAVVDHSRRHGEKIHQCEYCNKKFAIFKEYEKHKEAHSNETSYVCEYCGEAFTNKTKFLNHEENHVKENNFDCKHCEKVFPTRASLNRHHYCVHAEKKFLCVECGEKFISPSLLEKHMTKHTGEKPFKCNHCDKTFRLRRALKLHTFTHTGEKPLKCSVCTRGFRLRSHLKRHMFLHTGEKHLKCKYCEYTTFDVQYLKRHLWTHTGEDPLRCDVCEKKCLSFRKLKEHQKVCHGAAEEKEEVEVVPLFDSNK